jgi:hypothetical protein
MTAATCTRTHPQINALRVFIGLQCLDVLTTLTFLSKGLEEGNPLVHWALNTSHMHWAGLVLTKLVAVVIGQYCYRSGRMGLLRWANTGYSLVIGWNLIAIAAGAMAR